MGGGKLRRNSGAGGDGVGGGFLRCGCPPPRLFTFAAPGRNGAGTFYGACLTVFRCVFVLGEGWWGNVMVTYG